MICLLNDQIFLGSPGEGAVPCSIDQITLELVGSAVGHVKPEVLREATAAVLHYFKEEMGRIQITPEEFGEALGKVLTGLGVSIEITEVLSEPAGSCVTIREDLRALAMEAGKLGELGFFPKLHEVLRRSLEEGGTTVEFRGLRPAVKQLLGRKHWNQSCRELEERILETLRGWWWGELKDAASRSLLVR